MNAIVHGLYLVAELVLRLVVSPHLRARCLRGLGASVGANVRVYECRFINVADGFRNLSLADDVHVGTDCLIDLKGKVDIGRGSTLSPRVTVISHSDPGSSHNSPLVRHYPCDTAGVEVGEYCWIGASSTLISGARIGNGSVVGAMSLVRGVLEPATLNVGIPARKIRAMKH